MSQLSRAEDEGKSGCGKIQAGTLTRAGVCWNRTIRQGLDKRRREAQGTSHPCRTRASNADSLAMESLRLLRLHNRVVLEGYLSAQTSQFLLRDRVRGPSHSVI